MLNDVLKNERSYCKIILTFNEYNKLAKVKMIKNKLLIKQSQEGLFTFRHTNSIQISESSFCHML
ncbi:hypothetical protein DXC38_08725 [Bacteroides sp. 3_1_33FAA]|nr:hypothetical protein DXC38_08725 [Bacteroides sp. 3_1_33FAA]